jgi:hypothetical protein
MGGREWMGWNLYLLARYASLLRSLAPLAGGWKYYNWNLLTELFIGGRRLDKSRLPSGWVQLYSQRVWMLSPDQLCALDLLQWSDRERGCQIDRVWHSVRQRICLIWQSSRSRLDCDGCNGSRAHPGDRHLPCFNHLSAHPHTYSCSGKIIVFFINRWRAQNIFLLQIN